MQFPRLFPRIRSPSLPDTVQEEIGASLACINYNRGLDTSEFSWQSFHFATFNADQGTGFHQQ